jgi:flagellar motor switch/type III secretory pathway protein FliN
MLRDARAALQQHVRVERMAEVMSAVLGCKAELVLRDLQSVRQPTLGYPGGACCLLQAPDGMPAVLLELEAELAHRLVALLLARPLRWVDRSRPAPVTVQAAVGAACLAAARRACPAVPLSLRAVDTAAWQTFVAAIQSGVLRAQATLLLDGEPFGVRAHVLAVQRPTAADSVFGPAELARLGAVPVELGIVAARSVTQARELAALGVGDAWMPGEGWTLREEEGTMGGPVALCAPGSSVGLAAVLHADGRIVLEEGLMRVDDEMQQEPATRTSVAGSLAEAIGEAPIVVRVEVGSVVMRAQDWATLRPGDVVTTGRRLGERVTLRAGSVEIARGELVDVEGELGVRIHDVITLGQGEMR